MLQPLQGFEEISSALHFEFTFFCLKNQQIHRNQKSSREFGKSNESKAKNNNN